RGGGPRADRAVVAARFVGPAGGLRPAGLRVGRRATDAAGRRRAPAAVRRLRGAGAGGPPRGGPNRPGGLPVVRELADRPTAGGSPPRDRPAGARPLGRTGRRRRAPLPHGGRARGLGTARGTARCALARPPAP